MATKIFKVGEVQFETDGIGLTVRMGKKFSIINPDDSKELFDWIGQELLSAKTIPAVLPESFAKMEIALPQQKEPGDLDNRRVATPVYPRLEAGAELMDVAKEKGLKPSGNIVIWEGPSEPQ